MEQKLLVITIGTVAAGVGQEFTRQMNARPANAKRLRATVRSIDTTHLPATYGDLLTGEWFSMSIDPQFVDAIRDNIQVHFPALQHLLYANPPETSMAGGGGIRYNGAGAVIINQEQLREWLKESFNDLASLGDRQRNIAVALVISAVGATGSGSIERLIDIVVGAAQMAGVVTPLHLNTFILQPGTVNVTDLGLANTVALYSEMAASQLTNTTTTRRRYQGRTIMMGWGDTYSLASLAQLQEVTATLLRIVSDPISGIAAQYLQRVVDNHVLQDIDARTHLPSHLSAATPITISLGNLEEQFIARDVSRLCEEIIIGKPHANEEEARVNIFQNAVTRFLAGNTSVEQYEHLLESVSEGINLQSFFITADQIRNGGKPPIQATRLRGLWQGDLERLTAQGRTQMDQRGRGLADDAIKEMTRSRQQAIERGIPLNHIRRDYDNLLASVIAAQREAHRYGTEDTSSKADVEAKLNALARPGFFSAQQALNSVLIAVQQHLRNVSFRTANTTSVGVLRTLARHCTTALAELNTLISEAQRIIQRSGRYGTEFVIEGSHLLHLPALTEQTQVQKYYDKVSIFARPTNSDDDFADNENEVEADSLGRFRRWVKQEGKFEVFFGGDFRNLEIVFFDYTSQVVHERMRQYTVLDVLLEKNALGARMAEAATKADVLVAFNRNLASKCREVRHVIAMYRDNQNKQVQNMVDSAFKKGECTLIYSDDPTEIIVFYYVDGLPASSVKDLTGRCLSAFLERRREWYQTNSQNGQGTGLRRSSVPVYSGRDAETLVRKMNILCNLYRVRDRSVVKDYTSQEISELECLDQVESQGSDGADTSH